MTLSDQLPRGALVTGAGKRIGRAIALDLAAHGFAVAVHYNGSAEAAHGVVAEIVAQGGSAVALQADLADEAAVERLIPAAVAALGRSACWSTMPRASTMIRSRAPRAPAGIGTWRRTCAHPSC